MAVADVLAWRKGGQSDCSALSRHSRPRYLQKNQTASEMKARYET